MENGISKAKYPPFCHWDVNKYQSEYPPEHWDLCRLFMVANKTKYPEARLAQLTQAFFNMGVHGRCTDPKTDRMVAALSIRLVEHTLHTHPGAVNHSLVNPPVEHAIDSRQGIKPGSGAESIKSAKEGDNSMQRGYSRLAEQKQEPSGQSSVVSSNSLQSKQCSLERNAGSFESQPGSSKNQTRFSAEGQHSTTPEQKFFTQKRVSAVLIEGSDQNQDSNDLKLEFSESKRRRLTTTNNLTSLNESPPDNKARDKVAELYKLKKIIDTNNLEKLLRGLIIVRGVTKESTLNTDDVSVVEDSFKCSKFGPCTWLIEDVEESKGVIRVSLQSQGEVLVEAEGQNEDFLKLKIAEAFLSQMALISPIIKAAQSYYNDGKSRELPKSDRRAHQISQYRYSFDHLKLVIGNYSAKEDFSELFALQFGDSPEDFRIQDIIEFIEQEKADKLKYRLANFLYQGKSYPAICVSQIHDGQALFQWLTKYNDGRYQMDDSSKFDMSSWKYPTTVYKSSGTPSGDTTDTPLPTLPLGERKRLLKERKRAEGTWLPKSRWRNSIGLGPKKKNKHKEVTNGANEKLGNGENRQKTNRCSASRNEESSNSDSRSSTNNKKSDTKSGPKDSYKDNVSNKTDSSQSTPKHEGSSITNSTSREISLSQVKNSTESNKFQPAPMSNLPVLASKKEELSLSWVGKEHLSTLGKSIYIVKFVKEDSTTEKDPFRLLSSTCSLAFNLEIKYVMNPCGDKQWHVLVVLKHDSGNILVGEATAGSCAEARLAAAQDAVNTIQAYCRVVEPNFKYFAEGGEPTFISRKHPMKTSTYEIMNMNTSKTTLNQEVVNILLEMFINDNTVEDIFFLASDFSSEERECVRRASIQYSLGWRLFGQRSRASTEGDIVSTQHVCVFRPKSAKDVVLQLIISGGSTDKYSIVTKPNAISAHAVGSGVVAKRPVTSKLREICVSEDIPGGCWNSNCSLAHQNIVDLAVNKFLKIR